MNPESLQADAEAAIVSRDRRRSLSLAAHERLRELLLDDSYLFAKRICKHLDLVPSVHMPISYMVCGRTDRLIETLDMPNLDGYVTRKLRLEFIRRFGHLGVYPWRTPEGRAAIDNLINGSLHRPAVLNIRMSRRFFKSSVITHAGALFIATRDPNETIKITHAVDPKAWEFCDQIGRTVLSGTYKDFFPDRVPEGDRTKLVTMKHITLGGRTISHPQTTIQASGINTKEEAAHYSTYFNDDIVTDNSLPEEIKYAVTWLKRLSGFYMPTRTIRRIEVGTKHDEEDDDAFLTSKMMAEECLTLRVPIEEYDGPVKNILERGKPTCPELFPSERIRAEQIHVLSGEEDEDGYKTWWNQYLLSATGGSLRLFPPELVDDPDRQWKGPFEHSDAAGRKLKRYLVGRFSRDSEGRPRAKRGEAIWKYEGQLVDGWVKGAVLVDDWREKAEIESFDPWTEMDRVLILDSSWANTNESDNWAVSAIGQDVDFVRYQLQTLSDRTGIEGWISALAYLDEFWRPRVIGYDGQASQEPVIQNLMRTDRRLRRLASRMVPVKGTIKSKASRMQEGLSQPLHAYKFLLAPTYRVNNVDQFGGVMTRDELKSIKSTIKHAVRTDQDGIADSLAMSGAVLRAARKRDGATTQERRVIDPVLGIPVIEMHQTMVVR